KVAGKAPAVKLSYKRGAKRITTQLPVIDIKVDAGGLFGFGMDVTLLLEAQDKQGNVVGEPKPGGPVNLATMTLTLTPGSTTQVILKMDREYEGKFTVKALDPTTLTTFDSLELETDYTV